MKDERCSLTYIYICNTFIFGLKISNRIIAKLLNGVCHGHNLLMMGVEVLLIYLKQCYLQIYIIYSCLYSYIIYAYNKRIHYFRVSIFSELLNMLF